MVRMLFVKYEIWGSWAETGLDSQQKKKIQKLAGPPKNWFFWEFPFSLWDKDRFFFTQPLNSKIPGWSLDSFLIVKGVGNEGMWN